MSFSRLMRRLSSSLLGELDDENNEANNATINGSNGLPPPVPPRNPLPDPSEEPVLFCKNNVCIHPPTSVSTKIDHCPGYLSIKSHMDEYGGTTLFLTWIPNSQLKAHSHVADSLTSGATPLLTPPPPKTKVWRTRGSSASSDQIHTEPTGFLFRVGSEGANMFESIKGLLSGPPSRAQSRPESPNGGNPVNTTYDSKVVKIARLGSSTSSEDEPQAKVNPEEFQALLADINNFCLSQGNTAGGVPNSDQKGVRKQSSTDSDNKPPSAVNGHRKTSGGSSTSSPFSPTSSNHFTYPDEKVS
jgi:hypothetical protein